MTFQELRNRVIVDGIADVEQTYEADDPKRVGAIEGFELCRSLDSREAFEIVIRARQHREHRMQLSTEFVEKLRADGLDMPEPIEATMDDYWRHRYGTLQVEWVLSCLLVAGWARPGEAVSGRAALKVAEATGQSLTP